ncbi:MAG TPA: HD domain-containing protein [Nitrospirota bacterium]|nr:HD domain-containing protein [Nitrospirota bacterium]
MNQENLIALKDWFAGYAASFSTPAAEEQRNIAIKRDHTYEVCGNALRIARDLGLSEGEALLAEAVALLHDVGRFSQYRQYRTFDDSVSVNHAALGVKVLLETKALEGLPQHDRDLIVRAITLHNVFSLPEGLDETTLLFARLIRDADKLDVMRVVLEFFGQKEESRADAVGLGLPDEPGYSPVVVASLARREMAKKSDLTTLNDFKLLQLAWLYDLNFASSLRMVLERGYIDRLAGLLPDTDEIRRAVAVVRAAVDERLCVG